MMFLLNILTPLVFFFLLYLGLQIFKNNLFFIYLFQLKEYRLDRLRAHFKTLSGRRDLWHHFNLIKWKGFYRPKFTLRAILILFLIFFSQYNLFFSSLRLAFRFLRKFPTDSISLAASLIAALFLINLTTPLLVLFFSLLTSWLCLPLKRLTVFLAKKKITKMKNLLVIGVTGSYGKTAVKEILSFVLADFFKVLKTPFNCNTEVGIACQILKKLRKSHQVFVVEMGAYQRGEIEKICQMVFPKIGIVTGINEQHLELFGSLDKTQWAKFELIKSLPKKGLAVFNQSDHYVQRLIKMTKIKKALYGRKRESVKVDLPGEWHQQNVQAVLAVTDFLKLSREGVLERLRELDKIPLALELKSGVKNSQLIDDSYSANPTGFFSALDFLKKTKAKEKILVTPGIIELGAKSAEIHRAIGRKASRICTKIFLTKRDFQKDFQKGMAGKKSENFLEIEEDEVELFEKIKELISERTVVLFEGRMPGRLVRRLTSHD